MDGSISRQEAARHKVLGRAEVVEEDEADQVPVIKRRSMIESQAKYFTPPRIGLSGHQDVGAVSSQVCFQSQLSFN